MALKKPDNITQEEWDSMSETDKNDAWIESGTFNFLASTDKYRTVTDENGKSVLQVVGEGSSGEDLTGVSSLDGTNDHIVITYSVANDIKNVGSMSIWLKNTDASQNDTIFNLHKILTTYS